MHFAFGQVDHFGASLQKTGFIKGKRVNVSATDAYLFTLFCSPVLDTLFLFVFQNKTYFPVCH